MSMLINDNPPFPPAPRGPLHTGPALVGETGRRRGTYILPVAPIAWKRAVPLRRGRAYNAQKYDMVALGLILRKQHGDAPLFTGPLRITAYFYFEYTQEQLRQLKKIEKGGILMYHYVKPDYDNLAKFIGDCAQSVLFENDCQIAVAELWKLRGPEPCTIFHIEELNVLDLY